MLIIRLIRQFNILFTNSEMFFILFASGIQVISHLGGNAGSYFMFLRQACAFVQIQNHLLLLLSNLIDKINI